MDLTAVPIDFGNGIVVYSRLCGADAYLEKGHVGFHSPDFDVVVTENAVADGGSLGATRALSRHLRGSISHKALWTRKEILRAFSPGVTRVVSTPLGAMPYQIEAPVEFPDNLFDAQYRFTVTLVSPWAYPAAAPRSAFTGSEAGDGLVFPFAYPATFDTVVPSEAIELVNDGDVRTPAKLTIVPNLDASEVLVTIGDRVTRLAGDITAGDVIVIDPTPSSPVVTVNGVNRLSWFDPFTEWPALDPGYSVVGVSVISRLTVEWEPRVLGLI